MRMFAVWYIDTLGATHVNVVRAADKAQAKAMTRKDLEITTTGAVIEMKNRG